MVDLGGNRTLDLCLSDGFLDAIITKVNRAPSERFTDEITDEELKQLCMAAMDVFQRQPSLVRIEPPTSIVGDIHGQFWDLQRIFATHGHPPEQQYVFLGDYVDRGPHSLETIIILFCYKLKYPSNFMLLRGNNECPSTNKLWLLRQGQAPVPASAPPSSLRPLQSGLRLEAIRRNDQREDPLHALRPFQLSTLHRPLAEPRLCSLELDLLCADPAPGIRGVARVQEEPASGSARTWSRECAPGLASTTLSERINSSRTESNISPVAA
ncbi:hypothetical protein niasHT_017562 [Heterodera trifolii]|uniref:protein-serine/threonine phosphatase n=1 Tax=Heterodera trifolii TaxID=157864 RepID=A0ABD2L686_9BILA